MEFMSHLSGHQVLLNPHQGMETYDDRDDDPPDEFYGRRNNANKMIANEYVPPGIILLSDSSRGAFSLLLEFPKVILPEGIEVSSSLPLHRRDFLNQIEFQRRSCQSRQPQVQLKSCLEKPTREGRDSRRPSQVKVSLDGEGRRRNDRYPVASLSPAMNAGGKNLQNLASPLPNVGSAPSLQPPISLPVNVTFKQQCVAASFSALFLFIEGMFSMCCSDSDLLNGGGILPNGILLLAEAPCFLKSAEYLSLLHFHSVSAGLVCLLK